MFKKGRSILGILFYSFSLILISSGVAFSQGNILNQLPNQANGFQSNGTSYRTADNFLLSNQATISQIRIWGSYPPNTPPSGDNFTIIFHNDAAGLPGAVISTENSVPVVRQATGALMSGAYTEYSYDFTLANPVSLTPGTYWVEIYNDVPGGFFWDAGNLDVSHGIPGAYQYGYGGRSEDLAIQITEESSAIPTIAIPTMNEWGMIIFIALAGIGAVYFIRRQRRVEI